MRDEGFSGSHSVNRFAFSASGSYKAPYKSEPLVVGVVIGALSVLEILVTLFLGKIMKDNLKMETGDGMAIAAIVIGWFAVTAIIFAVGVVLAKIARSGYKCSYIADEERFITNEGGNSRMIFYRDVLAVHFVPRSAFGKVRGYEVTVKLKGTEEVYGVVSDGFISEKSTPFYIITERVEEIRREESRKLYEEQVAKIGVGVSDPIPPQMESVSLNEKADPSLRLGQDAQMPTVGLSAISKPAPAKAAPTPANFASQNENETFMGSDGREKLYSDSLGSGRFKVAYSTGKTIAFIVAAVAALVLFVNLALFNIGKFVLFLLFLLVGIAIAWVLVTIAFLGEEYTYRANGREFVVTNKNGGETHIVYDETQGVNYFGTLLGYKVEILTRYGIISYNCVDNRKRVYKTPEKLPFDIIAKRIK